MGCVASRIGKEERVRICRERKRLMKQLLRYRKEFADAQLTYLRSLKNTGATLRQFTESESLEIEEITSGYGFPPSPPQPLPPSPPPPPTFSPDLRKFENNKPPQAQPSAVEIEINEDSSQTPPPPVPSSSWEYWDPFGSPPPQGGRLSETVEQVEEENWADTNTDFVDDNEDGIILADEVDPSLVSKQVVEFDDNSSTRSWHTKDNTDMAMVVWRGKKTLTCIVKDLDEYFLKASAVVKDVTVFIDVHVGVPFLYQSIEDNKRKRSNSAKVFSALTWSWSSKSLQSNMETGDLSGSADPCKPGAHCITLQKLYSQEKKLYKDVKEEANAKAEYGRKSLLLQRLEEEHDWAKAEKTRSTVESLESYILSLQESIGKSYSNILRLRNEELHSQLNALASGLMHMWQTMHKCHQVQNHISQLLNHLTDQQIMEPTSEYHRQAAAQLQTEVASWYNSFCKLFKYQKEYFKALSNWTELTSCLEETGSPDGGNSSSLHTLTKTWLQALDNLPDKMVSEAIMHLLSSVQSIVVQQQEECSMRKRSDKLTRKLERERTSLSEVEMKFAGSFPAEDANSIPMSKHPLLVRRAKVEALKRSVDDEKAKYAECTKITRAMILKNLQTSLPKVFQALMVYSDTYVRTLEAIVNNSTTSE